MWIFSLIKSVVWFTRSGLCTLYCSVLGGLFFLCVFLFERKPFNSCNSHLPTPLISPSISILFNFIVFSRFMFNSLKYGYYYITYIIHIYVYHLSFKSKGNLSCVCQIFSYVYQLVVHGVSDKIDRHVQLVLRQ